MLAIEFLVRLGDGDNKSFNVSHFLSPVDSLAHGFVT